MDTRNSQFKRIALIVTAVLFIITLIIFTYASWALEPGLVPWWMILLNVLLVSIPLALLFGSLYVLVIAWRERFTLRQVSPRLAQIIYRLPRAAAILIIVFISLFSLDVFEMQASPLELLGGFLMHNLPSIALLVLLIIAWKRPVVGFVGFLGAAVFFTAFFIRGANNWSTFLIIALPLLLIALLFYADWKWLTPQAPPAAGGAEQP